MARIVVITGNVDATDDEQSFIDALESRQHTVTQIADHNASIAAVNLQSPELVIILDHAYYTQMPDISALAIPIICFDHDIAWRTLKMGTGGGGNSQTTINVINASNPLSGGLSTGVHSVFNSGTTTVRYITGVSSGGQIAATTGATEQAALVLVPAGAALTSGTAAGVRIFAYIGANVSYSELGVKGIQQFDAWLDYTLNATDTFAIIGNSEFTRGETFTLNLKNGGTSGTVTIGGVSVPVTYWDENLATGTIPHELNVLHGIRTVVATNNEGLTATLSIGVGPPSGWSFVTTQNPDNSSKSIFRQMINGPAITGTQVVYERVTQAGRVVNVYANGQFTNNYGGDAVALDTFNAYAIEPDGSIGQVAEVSVDDPANDPGGGEPDNLFPTVVSPVGNIVGNVGSLISYPLSSHFSDPEGGTLTFAKASGVSEITISSTGVLNATFFSSGTRNVVVAVTDDQNQTIQHEFYIIAEAAAAAPQLQSLYLFTVAEGSIIAGDARAVNHGAQFLYSISGTDSNRFTINSSTGELSFLTPPSYLAPVDADTDNQYQLTLTVTSDGGTTSAPVVVQVTQAAQDTTPDQFAFGTINGAIPEQPYTKVAEIRGVDEGITLHVTNGELSNDNQGSWTTQAIPYVTGQTFVRATVTAASTPSTSISKLVSVNNMSSTLTVVTRQAVSPQADLTQQINITQIKLFDTDIKLTIVESEIYQGDTLSFNCEIEPAAYRVGLRVHIFLKETPDAPFAVFEKEFDAFDDEQDTLIGYLSRADTIGIEPNDYTVIVRVFNDSMGLSKEFHGKIKVRKSGVV